MTDRSKNRPSPATDEQPWHTTLAGALGEAIGRGSDGKPDLGALVVPLLRSGAGAALIGNLLGVSGARDEAPSVSTATPDPHPLDDMPIRHGGASSPLAAILPQGPSATGAGAGASASASAPKLDAEPLLNALLGNTPPSR